MAVVKPEVPNRCNTIKSKRLAFHRLVKQIFRISQMCCVAPILDGKSKSSVSRRLHHIWCLTITLYIYVVNYLQSKNINPHYVTIEKALYLSEFLTNSVIITVIIGATYYYADYYRTLPQRLEKLYKDIRQYHIESSRKGDLYAVLQRELRCLAWFVGTFLGCCFAIDFVYCDYDIVKSLYSSGAYNVPNVLISMNLVQYWLAMRSICLLYRRLNRALEQLNSQLFTSTPQLCQLAELPFPLSVEPAWYKREYGMHAKQGRAGQHETLEFLRSLYSELDNLTAQLVNAFGFILILNFLASFLDSSVEYFAIYKFFDRPQTYVPTVAEYVLFTYKFVWLALHTGRIFFVLMTNHAIIHEKCRTCFILNEMEASSKDKEHAINRFLLQLMVRKPSESACGVFDLDLLFLGGIASALANYVIFLIQIDLGSESLLGVKLNKTT